VEGIVGCMQRRDDIGSAGIDPDRRVFKMLETRDSHAAADWTLPKTSVFTSG
jgi:hypothetical protein